MPLNCGAHRYGDTGEYFCKVDCPDCAALNDNVKYSREIGLVVYVDAEWLTNDYESEEGDGWRGLEHQLQVKLNRIGMPRVKLVLGSWNEEPVVEKSTTP